MWWWWEGGAGGGARRQWRQTSGKHIIHQKETRRENWSRSRDLGSLDFGSIFKKWGSFPSFWIWRQSLQDRSTDSSILENGGDKFKFLSFGWREKFICMCDRCLYVASMEMACWLGFHRTLCHVEARREMRAPISRERYGVPTYVRSTDREVDLSVVTPIKSSVSRGVEEIPFACLSVSVPAHVMKAL